MAFVTCDHLSQKKEVSESVNCKAKDNPKPVSTAATPEGPPPSLVSHRLCDIQHVHYDWNDTV